MKNAESKLVISLIAYILVITSFVNSSMPKSSLKAWYFGEGLKFDKMRTRIYGLFLLGFFLLSTVYGYVVSKNLRLTAEFVGIGMIVTAIAGINLIMYRRTGGKSS